MQFTGDVQLTKDLGNELVLNAQRFNVKAASRAESLDLNSQRGAHGGKLPQTAVDKTAAHMAHTHTHAHREIHTSLRTRVWPLENQMKLKKKPTTASALPSTLVG